MSARPAEFDEFLMRARKLEKSAFWKWLTTRRGQSDMPRIIAGDWLAHDKLNEDELAAFCLNLRLFVQGTDGFSIRQIAEQSQKWPDLYTEEKEGIQNAVAAMNAELAAPSLVSIFKDKPTSNRDVFEVIFYGGLVHSNPGKRELYSALIKSGLFSYFVFSAFTSTLFHFRNCIQSIAHFLSHYVIKEYGDPG